MWTNALFSFFFLPLAPAAAPGRLTGQNDTSTSVSVSWQALPKAARNGIIITYTLYYRVQGTTGQKSMKQTSALNARITCLSIFTKYAISVSASTSAGEGPDSDDIIIRTGEASKLTECELFW